MGRISVALRLRFVKLPESTDERIFRDVLRLAREPEDRVLDALMDIVDKKLSFMEIAASGAEVTLFYHEANGDRVVIDAPYYEQLVRRWVRTSRKHRTRAGTPLGKRARVEEATPVLLAASVPTVEASTPHTRERDISDRRSRSRSTGSRSSCGSSASSSSSDAPELSETIEIEVRRRGDATMATTTGPAATARTTAAAAGAATKMPGLGSKNYPSPNVSALTNTTTGTARAAVPVAAPPAMPLTATNLAKVVAAAPTVSLLSALSDPVGCAASPTAVAGPQYVPLAELTFPPVNPHFYVRCVVLSIRVKLPKAGMMVTEVELCDAADPSVHITAVTFDEIVQRGIRENLRGDRRQVVELRNVTLRRKNELDRRYQTNWHPLQLRLERHCLIEVVQILPLPVGAAQPVSNGPVASSHGSSANRNVTVRASLHPNGVLDVAELAAAAMGQLPPSTSSDVRGGLVGSSSSSSHSGVAQRRTTFSFSSGGASSAGSRGQETLGSAARASVAGAGADAVAAPLAYVSALGSHTRAQQVAYLRGQPEPAADALPHEPGVRRVTAQELQQRDALLQHHANREMQRKERLRQRAPVSQRCLLCTLDLDDTDDTTARVRRLLEASHRNRGSQVPTVETLRAALSDPRRRPPSQSGCGSPAGPRLVCKARFLNTVTRAVQVVHPRCAHLCTAYQKGASLEDIVAYEADMQTCTLCGMAGATVSCYHPDCREMYHVVCALFSNGYVNFGKRDPYLPCPACPRHTQVVVDAHGNASSPRSGHEYVVQGNDPSCWEDDIVFDSRVVEETDLRDPDENGGL